MKKLWLALIPSLLALDALIGGIPQIIRILQTRSSNDVSIFTWGFSAFTCLLWIYQAKKEGSKNLMLGAVAWFVIDAVVVAVSLCFRN